MAIIEAIPPSFWRRLTRTVAAGATVVVDTVPLARFKATKYLVHLSAEAQSKYKALEIWASRQGGQINESVYAKLGDTLAVSLNWSVVGSDVELQLVNDEAFDVSVIVTKLI